MFLLWFSFPLSSSGSHSYHSWCYRSYLCFTISCLLKFGRNCCLANLGSHCCLWDCTQGLCCNLLRFVPSLLLSTKGIMIIPTLTIWRCNSDSFSLTANWFTCQVTTYVVTRPGRELLFTVVSQDEKYKAKVCLLESSYFKNTWSNFWLFALIFIHHLDLLCLYSLLLSSLDNKYFAWVYPGLHLSFCSLLSSPITVCHVAKFIEIFSTIGCVITNVQSIALTEIQNITSLQTFNCRYVLMCLFKDWGTLQQQECTNYSLAPSMEKLRPFRSTLYLYVWLFLFALLVPSFIDIFNIKIIRLSLGVMIWCLLLHLLLSQICLLWIVTAIYLGRRQSNLAQLQAVSTS